MYLYISIVILIFDIYFIYFANKELGNFFNLIYIQFKLIPFVEVVMVSTDTVDNQMQVQEQFLW